MKTTKAISNLLLVACAAAMQLPAQWTSNSHTNKPLLFIRFPYSEGDAVTPSLEEKATATQLEAVDSTSHSSQTTYLQEWRDISRRLSEMEAQIEALKRDIEDLKTGNEHVNKTAHNSGPTSAGTEESFTCEGESTVIACSSGKGIVVDFANYGRTSHTICIYDDRVDPVNNCFTAAHTKMIGKLCNGQSSCLVRATNDFFGDTCPYVYKYLQIKFRCV